MYSLTDRSLWEWINYVVTRGFVVPWDGKGWWGSSWGRDPIRPVLRLTTNLLKFLTKRVDQKKNKETKEIVGGSETDEKENRDFERPRYRPLLPPIATRLTDPPLITNPLTYARFTNPGWVLRLTKNIFESRSRVRCLVISGTQSNMNYKKL